MHAINGANEERSSFEKAHVDPKTTEIFSSTRTEGQFDGTLHRNSIKVPFFR